MLQDIAPSTYNNEFSFVEPQESDAILIYEGTSVLVRVEDGMLYPPTFADLHFDSLIARCVYLFRVDESAFFLAEVGQGAIDALMLKEGFAFIPLPQLVEYGPKSVRFALTVGYEYFTWYQTAQFCGRCGTPMNHDKHERMMRCPKCNNMVFPKLFPAVIVGITHPDGRVLVTRYAGRPVTTRALVAGFCEMGETVEQTVAREVMEEVGLRVKNIRYYKSQPWPLSSTLLFGFFCEVDGSDEITVNHNELAMAEWVDREELLDDNDHSLTREMMGVLRRGEDLL